MHPVAQTVVITASIVVIAVGALYVTQHVDCFNFFGLAKGCLTLR